MTVDAQASEVDVDDVVGLLRLLGAHLAVGRDDPHLVLVDDDQAGTVAGRDEPVDGLEERFGAPRRQVEALQGRARRVVVEASQVVAERAGDGGA